MKSIPIIVVNLCAGWRRVGIGSLMSAWMIVATPACPAWAVTVKEVVSPGGIRALLVQDSTVPVISMNILWRGGSAADPTGKEGAGKLMAALLDKGAGAMDEQAFNAHIDALALRLRFGMDGDRFYASVSTLSEHKVAAFEALRLTLTAPRFDDDSLARTRARHLIHIRQGDTDPKFLARQALFQDLFRTHPYARSFALDGQERSTRLKALQADDLRAALRTRAARDNMFIGVSGDISPTELAALLETTFMELPPHASIPSIAEIDIAPTGRILHVQVAVPQSFIFFVGRGLKRNHPDFYTALVLNHILGGGSASRLHKQVRETRGLAYSINSFLIPRDGAALWMGTSGTQGARAQETVDVIRAQLRDIHDNGVSAAELATAKGYINGSWPLRFTSSGQVARILARIRYHNLGLDYLDRRKALIDAVSGGDIRTLAKKYLDPDAFDYAIAGDTH